MKITKTEAKNSTRVEWFCCGRFPQEEEMEKWIFGSDEIWGTKEVDNCYSLENKRNGNKHRRSILKFFPSFKVQETIMVSRCLRIMLSH